MKLKEIAKLNAERTQGKWEFNDDFFWCDTQNDYFIYGHGGYGDESLNIKDQDGQFIAAAPKMADMLCKLKDFKVTSEFVLAVEEKCKRLHNTSLNPDNLYVCLYALVIKTLIEELEKDGK